MPANGRRDLIQRLKFKEETDFNVWQKESNALKNLVHTSDGEYLQIRYAGREVECATGNKGNMYLGLSI